MIRDKESLQRMYDECKRRHERKKDKQAAKYAAARDETRTMMRMKAEEEKARQNEALTAQEERDRQLLHMPLPIYGTKYIERFPDDDRSVYTKEELMSPPEGETGRIDWKKWRESVKATKKLLYMTCHDEEISIKNLP